MNFKPIPRRFEPSDEELIEKYLKCKIMNFADCSGVIPEAIIYGDNLNPWEKFGEGSGYPLHSGVDSMGKEADYDRLFVFTKITNVGKKSGDFQKNRLAGDGKWHGNHKTEVQRPNGNKLETIGYSRLMTFQLSNGKETVGHWTMNEYTIEPKAFPGLPPSDWVLCKIKMHHGKTSVAGKVIKSCQSKSKKRRQILGNGDREVLHQVVNPDNRDLHPHHQAVVNLDDDHQVVVSLDEQTLDHQGAESFGDLSFDVPDEWLPEIYSKEGFAGMTSTVDQDHNVPATDELMMQNEVAKELSTMDFDLDDELGGITAGVFGFPAMPSEDASRDINDEDFEEMFLGV